MKEKELLQEFLDNEKCSCIKLGQHPCPRCQVTIDETKELLGPSRDKDDWCAKCGFMVCRCLTPIAMVAHLKHLRSINTELLEALRGILEIGKRDMSNPKYNGYFDTAQAAIAKAEGKTR